MKMMKIVRAYVDAGFNVLITKQLVYVPNYNGGGYSCIAVLIKTTTFISMN